MKEKVTEYDNYIKNTYKNKTQKKEAVEICKLNKVKRSGLIAKIMLSFMKYHLLEIDKELEKQPVHTSKTTTDQQQPIRNNHPKKKKSKEKTSTISNLLGLFRKKQTKPVLNLNGETTEQPLEEESHSTLPDINSNQRNIKENNQNPIQFTQDIQNLDLQKILKTNDSLYDNKDVQKFGNFKKINLPPTQPNPTPRNTEQPNPTPRNTELYLLPRRNNLYRQNFSNFNYKYMIETSQNQHKSNDMFKGWLN